MEPLSDSTLVVVIQDLQLALDYQYQQLGRGSDGPDDPVDLKECLVQVDLITGIFRAEYARRVARGAKLTPLADLPRIRLGPPAPCAHDASCASVHTRVSGRVVRHSAAHPLPGVAVELLDVGSRFPSFGFATPRSLGTAVSDRRGSFEVIVAGTYRREQIGVEFPGRDNLEAMAQGVQVVEVGATPTVSAR